MKNKKIYVFLLLALIIMLLPLGMVSAKYKQTKEVGKVTLDIAPPILSPNWYIKKSSEVTISELIVDSFKPEANSDIYSKLGLNWEDGIPVGYDSSNPDNFKNNVRLFEDNGTAYILAIGKNPVIFPENSNSLFAGWNIYAGTDKIIFNNINTSKVNNMAMMFAGSSSITSLEFGDKFDTSKVENMESMFNGCSGLTSLDVSNFKTSSVTNMESMFNSCSGLTTLDLNNFNTSKVVNMSTMFFKCKKLTSLDLSSFNTIYVKDMSSMFGDCNALTALNISIFNTTNVTDMGSMFSDCSSLTSLDLSSFNTQRVTNMSTMFKSCKNLITIYAGNSWNVDNVSNSNKMFSGCSNLVGGAGTSYSPSFVDNAYARIDNLPDNPGYLTEKPTSTSINTFSLVQEGGTITGTKTTGN
ncbi:BspA family leucine-rich repeat surface protein [Holdemanella porci]|uniref:BspA family leucine-rich repeat surface protein n=1 Tax=Holdemanella porci TaxID=2652276 RepID=UPI003F8F71B3